MTAPIDRVLDHLEGVRKLGTQLSSRCPAHEDKVASLTISEGDDGRVLLHCFAGCDVHDIVRGAGLEMTDLFPDARGARAPRVVAEYRYTDEHGKLLYVVERRDPKDFRQKTPDGAGWTYKLNGVRRVPYRLPEVLEGVAAGRWVVITEGERDVDNLRARGFVATCNSGGAGKWRDEWAPLFAGAKVAVIPDNDAPGRRHAEQVATSLGEVASTVRRLELPDVPDHGDVTDWFSAGGTEPELKALIAGAPEWDDDPPGLVSPPGAPYENAQRFVSNSYRHETRALLIHHGGSFEAWNDTCWPEVEDRALRAAIYKHFSDKSYWRNTKDGPELTPFDPTIRKVADIVDSLKAYTHVSQNVSAPAWLSGSGPLAARELLSLENGILHIPTRTLHEHTPDFYTSWSLPYPYDEAAPKPKRWLDFLDELWGDDDDLKQCLQEWFGYLISGDTRQQKMLMLVGPRRAGKGTVCRVLGGLLGDHNVEGPTLSSLSTNFGLSPLIGKPVAVIADARLRSDDSVIVERLLSISGEDLLTVDRKYSDHWTGKLPTRFVLVSNETPRLRDSSGALASRFIIVPFLKSFYGNEDTQLTDRLLEELPGILQWALDGLARLATRGRFVQPQAATELIQELEDLGSPVSAFLRDRCTVGPSCSVSAQELFLAWKDWCQTQGVEHTTNAATFGRDLRTVIPRLRKTRHRDDGRSATYQGIKLGTDDDAARAREEEAF